MRATRGSLLFSRCWLLVEGETEAPFLSECARILGYDLHAEGISCLEYSQVGVEKFIKLADQLGIEWFVLSDNDPAGEAYKNTAVGALNGRAEADHVRMLDHGPMEVFLSMEGFGHIYVANISPQKAATVTAQQGTLDYWKQVYKAQSKNAKPKTALAVTEEMETQGAGSMPTLIREVIEQARTLARSAG